MADGSTHYTGVNSMWIRDCKNEDDGNCLTEIQVGQIELYTRMEYDHTKNSDGEKKTIWGMEQQGKMLPGSDNTQWNSENCDHEQDWKSKYCDLDQNWTRSDLSSLDNGKYKPSTDKEAAVDATLTIGWKNVEVNVDVDYPKIKRDMDYRPNKGIYGNYYFQGYDGATDDSLLGQVSTWISDRPDSGDDIAPTWMYGEFRGPMCRDKNYDRRNRDGSLFEMFEWQDF
jgi:hypothetical protein